MSKAIQKFDRRGFIKKVTQSTAAIAISAYASSGSIPKKKELKLTNTIPTRVFGKTKAKLPILAYGGAALPKQWGNTKSYEDRVKLVRYAYNRGIRYFDTAGNYFDSQKILGEALSSVRDNVFLTSKVEVMQEKHTRSAFEKVLKELQTDYLDAIMIHGTPGLEQITVNEAMKIHGELEKLREEGLVRFIGFSAHSYFDKALALIESDGFDLCMLSYGYIPRGHNQIFSARMTELRNACVAKAHEKGMGIAAMKVIGAGILGAWSGYIVPDFEKKHLAKLPGSAIRHVLDDDRIDLLVIGMRLEEEINANIKIVNGETTYTSDDRTLLAEYSTKAYESDAIKQMRID